MDTEGFPARMNDKLFIELVQYHAVLYYLSHLKFMDTYLQQVIWNNIGIMTIIANSMTVNVGVLKITEHAA